MGAGNDTVGMITLPPLEKERDKLPPPLSVSLSCLASLVAAFGLSVAGEIGTGSLRAGGFNGMMYGDDNLLGAMGIGRVGFGEIGDFLGDERLDGLLL